MLHRMKGSTKVTTEVSFKNEVFQNNPKVKIFVLHLLEKL